MKHLRLIVEASLLALALFFMAQAKCAGEREGVLSERIAQEKERAEGFRKQADFLLRKSDSTEKLLKAKNANLTKTQALVKETSRKYTDAREAYRNLRDSIHVPEPITQAADSALLKADEHIAAQDSVIGLQAGIIDLQASQILTLKDVIVAKDASIRSLNAQMATMARQKSPPFLKRAASTTTKLAIGAAAGAIAWESIR